VIAAALLPVALIIGLSDINFKYEWGSASMIVQFWIVAAAAVGLAIVGAVDDIRPLPVLPRLLLQARAVAAIVVVAGRSIFPIPLPFEIALWILAGLWFVNLTNFMDGLDWMTVVEMVPITAVIAFLLAAEQMHGPAPVVAAALCGALIGFAIFNKPVARLFLGDVGSLPIGLLVGWMLLSLASEGALVAAILLPLYYLMDATLTLLRRLKNREKVWQAHRSHFYQRATDNGFSVIGVTGRIFVLNIVLGILALITIDRPTLLVHSAALIAGILAVSFILWRFSRPAVRMSSKVPA
jgi:UDP-N-acetylmuramyl pentapeptide phosphotransferase/UDP-N-acetylglucosamine-1-phosphate transferase